MSYKCGCSTVPICMYWIYESTYFSSLLNIQYPYRGAQLNEALQMQMAAQKRMNDQHEVRHMLTEENC